MGKDAIEVQRRTMLQMTVALAGAAQMAAASPAQAAAKAPAATGKPGDFDFLSGHWKIRHRQLKNGAWDAFEGEATVHGLLAGVASVEELRIPSRGFSGMGLRLLDLEKKLWADYWVNAKSGVLVPPPSWGSFVDGVGIWDADDTEGSVPVIYRGVWDQITPSSCRWHQASSRDDGRTWQESWVMHWTRV
ncbi:MAG: hypothetical protein K8R60_14240 [Burkholderiales bacterium]|nr:hypothetical protein [Burkholderiales bacterium]